MLAVTCRRRCFGLSIRAAWIPMLALALLSGARAFAEPPAQPGLELDLRDVPLVTAINMLIAQTGAEISFVDPEGKLAGRKVVLLSAHPKNVEEALQKICRATGCYFEKESGGEYVISPQPLAPEKPAPGPAAAAPVDSLPQTEEIQRIAIQYMDARDILSMLMNSTLAENNHVLPTLPHAAQQLSQRRQFRLGSGHDQLAADLMRQVVPATEGDHAAGTLHAGRCPVTHTGQPLEQVGRQDGVVSR